MKILVTGGAGFIGSHLVELLLEEGHEPIVIDDLSTGHLSNVPDNVPYLIGDCADAKELAKISKGCEFVYHLASTVGVDKVLSNPKECIENIVRSSQAVFGLGIPGMEFSTSEVYGKNTHILTEGEDLIYSSKTRWSYAASKLISEWLASAAGWKTVRLFNIVGPRQNLGYVFSNFVHQAGRGLPITVYGSGEQIRTFIDVRDTVKILEHLRTQEFDVVNVGAAHTLSMRELAKTIKRVTRSYSPIEIVPYDKAYKQGFDECPSRIPDLTKLHQMIGDMDHRPIEQTILATAYEDQNNS